MINYLPNKYAERERESVALYSHCNQWFIIKVCFGVCFVLFLLFLLFCYCFVLILCCFLLSFLCCFSGGWV